MSIATITILSITVFIAAFVQGVAGIGFALIVAPVAGLIAPELLPTALLVLMLPLNGYVAVRERNSIEMQGLTWITIGRIVFTIIGLGLVAMLSKSGLNIFVAVTTIAAAVVSLFAPPFDPTKKSLFIAGAVTGISETATGVGGPPMALVYQHAKASTIRATVASCFFVGEVVSLIFLVVSGVAKPGWLEASLILFPALILGIVASSITVRRAPHLNLRMAVIIFSIASGLVLLIQELV